MGNERILIKNGHIISPSDGLDLMGDILIEDGLIAAVGPVTEADGFEGKLIDARDCYVSPGFVDVHTHFRDPGQTEKEDIHSGSLSAAAGGYTTVICMANTIPAVDSPETLNLIKEKALKESIHVLQCACVTKDREGYALTDFEALLHAGAAGFTDDGSPLENPALAEEAMKRAAALGAVLSFHEEDPRYIGTTGINEGKISEMMRLKGADRLAEIRMVERDLALAMKTGCRIDIQHVSAAETVDLIRKAKSEDKNDLIHAEATPNHFSLTEEAVRRYGSLAKINPPLRTEEDKAAIIEGLKDGTIDLIATDHAPHTVSDKNKDFPDCMSGIIGLETAFSLGLQNLVKPGHLSLHDLITLMSVNPAKLYNIDAGHILEGHPADIVIFSCDEETTYDHFHGKSDNTPFKGQTLAGKIIHTISGGGIVY